MIELTVDQVKQIKAGPELNILIAEQVMGWTLYHRYLDRPANTQEDYDSAAQYDGWSWRGRKLFAEARKWQPSQNIEHAWEIIEHLNWLWFEVGRENCNGIRYDVLCYNTPRADPEFHAIAETVPLAICRVALLTTLENK